jgi:hypothetical protein
MLSPALALLLLAAPVPADPEAALLALQPFGEVESCAAHEVIVKLPKKPPRTMGGMRVVEMDHSHELQPAAKAPRLAGKSAAILPFLEHRNRRVVRRALDLACACPDPEAKAAVLALARRQGCHRFVREAPGGLGEPDVGFDLGAACEGAEPGQGFGQRFTGSPQDWKRWEGADARALAQKIDRGDAAALASAVSALESMDLSETRTAMAALALVRTPLGWATVARAFPRDVQGKPNGDYVDFAMNVAPHLLGNVAAAAKLERVDALVAILKLAPDVGEALNFIAVTEGLQGTLAARARKEARDPANPPEVRRFFEGSREGQAMSDPAGYAKVSDRLAGLFKAKDKAGLRAFQKDDANDRLHRLLAGSYLAQLGDAGGLALFEDPESVRSGQAHTIRSELESLLTSTKGPVRQRVQEVLKLYSGAQHPYDKVKDSLVP